MFYEFTPWRDCDPETGNPLAGLSGASANNMAVLPGALGCSFDYAQDKLTLRRTGQVRLGINPAAPRDGYPVARPSTWSRDSNS